MKHIIAGLALGLTVLASGGAEAMSLPAVSAPGSVQLVAQGCGPGFQRGYYGRCVPSYRRPPPPPYRRCPPGMHFTPSGRCYPN